MTVCQIAGDRRGFALIAVMWLVVLISVVGLDFSLRARGVTRRAIDAADFSAARAGAEGGLLLAEDRLVERLRTLPEGQTGNVDPWRNPGILLEDTMEIGDALVVVRLEDAGARLHLNEAGEPELRALFTALRVDDSDADLITQSILDWRDTDQLRRGRGAEKAEYVESGAAVLPADRPFSYMAELRYVSGMTAETYDRVAPFLTLVGSGRVSLSSAPAEVLSALPGMSDGLLTAILRARANGGEVPDLPALAADLDEADREAYSASLPVLLARTTNRVGEIAVRSESWTSGGAVRVEATAVAVRARDAVFIVERHIR